MSEIITSRDPVTWHNQRPTHCRQPEWLVEARRAAELAWKSYQAVCDRYEAGEVTHERVADSLASAVDAEEWRNDCYRAWQAGQTPASLVVSESVGHPYSQITSNL